MLLHLDHTQGHRYVWLCIVHVRYVFPVFEYRYESIHAVGTTISLNGV